MVETQIYPDPPQNRERYNHFLKRSLIALVVLNLFALLVWRGIVYRGEQKARAAERKVMTESVAEYTRIGVLFGTEGERMVDLEQGTKQSGRLSDGDLAWLLARMKEPEAATSQFGLRSSLMTEILALVKDPPPAQKELIFQAMVALIQQRDPSGIDLNQATAMSEFRRLGDTRAFPYIEPYLSDRHPLTRLHAILAMKRMKYPKLTEAQLSEVKKLMPRKLPPLTPIPSPK